MTARIWRRMLGWLLIVLGILAVLAGVIAIAGSYDPTTPDPGSTRLGGAIFIGFGLLVAGPGTLLVIKARSRRSQLEAKPPRPARELRKAHLVGSGVSAVLLVAIGVGAIIYSLSIDAAASSFKSAHQCTLSVADSNCYELRDVTITGVDITQGRSGETDTVQFVDARSAQKVALHPGNRDSSVLRTGARGVATLWQGKYTNLDVAGESFATLDNPVGQQGEWRLIGLLALGLGLLNGVGIAGVFRLLRKRAAATAIASGAPIGTNELLPTSAAFTSGYPGLPLVLHPVPFTRQVPVWALLVAVPVVALEIFSLAHYGPLVEWGLGGGLTLLLVVLFGWQILRRRRAAIFVDDLSFGTVDGLGRRRTWPRGEAARVALKSVARGRRTAPLELALIVGPDGRARMSVPAKRYDNDSLAQFAAALRVPFDDDPAAIPINPSALEREIPGSVSWSLRHATALGAGIAIVLIASFSVFAILGGVGPTHR